MEGSRETRPSEEAVRKGLSHLDAKVEAHGGNLADALEGFDGDGDLREVPDVPIGEEPEVTDEKFTDDELRDGTNG